MVASFRPAMGFTCRKVRSGLLLALSAWLAAPASAAEGDFTDGVGHYNKSRWKLAAESFRKFLKEDPDHKNAEQAQYYLGLTFINLDDHQQARDALRIFVAKHPMAKNVVAAQYWIGQCSYLLRDNAAAAKELLAFVEQAPDDPLADRALSYLGEVELELKQPEQAAAHLSLSLEKNAKGPTADAARYFLGRSHELLKKPEAAQPLYEQVAATQAPQAADAQIRLGKLEFDAGEFQKSAETFAAFEQRFPKSDKLPLARLNRGFALYELNQPAPAIAVLDQLLADPKYGDDALYWKGQSLKLLKDWPKAAATFKAGSERLKGTPRAERFLYQWAVTEQKQGQLEAARKLYVQVADAFPKGTYADESLNAATEVALLEGKFPEAQGLIARFDQQHASSPLKPAQDLLKGRILFAAAQPGPEGEPQREAALRTLELAMADASDPSKAMQARYYFGSMLQSQAQQRGRTAAQSLLDHARVLDATAPLAEAVEKDAALREMAGVFVLRGVSQLSLGKQTPTDMATARLQHLTSALQSGDRYLSLAPQGELLDQALAVRIIAQAHSGQNAAGLKDLDQLRALAPDSAALDEAILEVADMAFSLDDLPQAEALFAELTLRKAPRLNPRALLELGHTRAKMKKYAEAAVAFGRLADEFPADADAAEADYQRGKMLEELGTLDEASNAYQATFGKHPASEYGYLAGFAAGVVLARLQRLEDSERAFAATAQKHARRKDLDRLLHEWAGINCDNERYARADEIYRALIQQFPQSKYVGDARLALAESDLLANPPRVEQARAQFAALSDDAKVDSRVQERALFQLMQVETETQRWDELRKVCQKLQKGFPEGPYRFEAEFRLAEADFRQEAFPECQARLLKLKEQLLALGKPDEGNPTEVKPGSERTDTGGGTVRDEDSSQRPWYPQIWVMLAETQFRLKEYLEVEATAAEFRKLLPKSEFLYFVDETLGRTFKAQAMFPEARQAFERAINDTHGRLTETAAKSQFHLAETYLLEKDYEHALAEYLKVEIRYKFPEWQGLGLFQAAACYEALNDWKEAARTYEDMLKQFPEHAYVPQAKERLAAARQKL